MTTDFTPIDDLTGPGEARSTMDTLAGLFPDAVVDGRVDIDVLRDLLGDDAEPAGTEAFGLRWPGMSEARRLSTLPPTGTLLPKPDESVNWDETKNIVIEGDNLEVLRLLRRGYTNKVDVIYIDPPYNTGNDFVYDDSRMAGISEYEAEAGLRDDDGATQLGADSDRAQDRRAGASRHAKWLSMMYPRLMVAHHLLKETGVLIASIDDVEHARLKLLLDRVFGAENFIASVTWQGGRKNDAQFVSPSTDYMLIYVKNLEAHTDQRWREPKPGVDSILDAAEKSWNSAKADDKIATKLFREWWSSLAPEDPRRASQHYNRVDGVDGRGGMPYFAGDLGSPQPRPNLRYKIWHPQSQRPVNMPPNGWRYEEARMSRLIVDGRVRFGSDELSTPTIKRYLDETGTQTVLPVFYTDRRAASKRLASLLDGDVFTFPKDEKVLARWLNLVTRSKSDGGVKLWVHQRRPGVLPVSRLGWPIRGSVGGAR